MSAGPTRGGATFGDYRLLKRLATGGTSEVFLARTKSDAQVALKRVLPSLRDDVELAQEFLDEARIAAHLDHPYLVHVHDVGRQDRTVFLTMDYVRGATLAEVAGALKTRETPWPWTLAARTVSQVAEALEYLHAAEASDGTALGLVHRDVIVC